jgi:ethanolamine transporter EutH
MVLHAFGVDDIFVALKLLRSITVCWSIDLTLAGSGRLNASNWQ